MSVKEVFSRMRVSELNDIIKIFELQVRCRKKQNIIDIIYEYMKSNMEYIFREFIIYDEVNLLRKICDNNFKMPYGEEELRNEYLQALECIGIIYIDKDENMIAIPREFQLQVKSCINNMSINEFSKNRAEIKKMVENLLELYGVFHLELLEDYIINTIGAGYRVHKAIEFIRKYNQRNNFYYEDEDCFYYNLKITDIKSMKMRTLETNLKYKYYDKNEITDMVGRKSNYENDVKIILNRVYKNSKSSGEIVEVIKFMVIEGRTLEEIGCFIKEKIERLSEFGFKSIMKSVEKMRDDYIIWGFKGYYLEEINNEMMA